MGKQVDVIALIETDTHLPVKQCLERCDHGLRVEQTSNVKAFRRLISSKEFDCLLSMMESPSMWDIISFQLAQDPPIPVVLFPQNELEDLTNLENYKRLAGKIRRRLKPRNETGSKRRKTRGATTVIVRDNEVYVRGVDGKNVLWGYEDSPHDVAKTMELELNAIDYVRDRLADAVSDITEELYLTDLAPEHVSDIVYEGYRKLLLWFRDLDASIGHRMGN